jgi:hypothetical protein
VTLRKTNVVWVRHGTECFTRRNDVAEDRPEALLDPWDDLGPVVISQPPILALVGAHVAEGEEADVDCKPRRGFKDGRDVTPQFGPDGPVRDGDEVRP